MKEENKTYCHYRHVDTGIIMRGSSYRFTVYLGYTPSGKQIRKTTTFFPPAGLSLKAGDRLAKEKYIEYKIRIKGLSQFNENMKFKDLCTDYMEHYARVRLKETTEYNYEHQINAHFIDFLGNKRLKSINSVLLTGFFSDMKNLSFSTKKTSHHP